MAGGLDTESLARAQAHRDLDILLIHAEAGISPFMISVNFPPMGIIELASYLHANGFKVRVIDTRHIDFTIEWLAGFLAEARPRWVGISVLTDTLYQATRLTNLVRNSSPRSRVVIGGVHATMRSEDVLMELMPDAVVRGEGEIPTAELLSKEKLSEVRGITYLEGGKPVRTPDPPLLDLETKPAPDCRLVLGYRGLDYHPSVNTGRGCPYRCTFCAASTISPRVRWRSIGKVIEDVKFVMDTCEGDYLAIFDDTFTFDIKRTEEFCREIRKIGGGDKFVWYAEGRVDRLAGRTKLLHEMQESGLRFLQLGVESGDERILEAYKKQIDLADAETLCAECAEAGILVHAGFIMGGPFESPETARHTREFIGRIVEKSRGCLQILTACLNPLPGTEIFEDPARFGLALTDPDLFSSTAFDNAVTETDALSREEILRERQRTSLFSTERANEACLAREEPFFDYLGDVLTKVGGPYHNSLRNLVRMRSGGGWDAESLDREMIEIRESVMKAAGAYPQFYTEAGDLWNDLVPARLPFFKMGADDLYRILPDVELTDIESDVFHFSSGKLTGREISMILGEDHARVRAAIESLEKKEAIIHRTY